MLSEASGKEATTLGTVDASHEPPTLSGFSVPPSSPSVRRHDSFSSLDADDEADEPTTGPTRSATTLYSSSSLTSSPAPPSRHSMPEFMRERERAGKSPTNGASRGDDGDDDDKDDEDERGARGTSRAAMEEAAWGRRTAPACATTPTTTVEDTSGAQAPPALEPPTRPAMAFPSSHEDAKLSGSDHLGQLNLNASLGSARGATNAAETADDARIREAEVVKEAERRELLRNKMQEFGCCVLFFPAPIVSWLFPMTGNVAITNAEGSRLYTFESSYFVREEKLLTVLDTVLAEDDNFAELLEKPRPPPLHRRMASPTGGFLQPPSDGYITSPLVAPRSPLMTSLNPLSGTPAPPPRKPRQVTSKGHAHTRCVRMWDLKPLLMEARSQRRGQGSGASAHHRQSGPAAALWNLLTQELNNAVYSGGLTSDSDHSKTRGRRTAMGSDRSSGGVTEDDDEPYEFLDACTARMFNRNLQASIKIFRGSPHGGSTQSERLFEELNSFSFVCFVLEACGVGGWARPPPRPVRARPPPRALPSAASSAPPAPPAKSGAGNDEDEDSRAPETSWGFIKLCIHLCVFGRWYRCGGRARRVLHGGSFTTAVLLWALLLSFLFYYLFPPHQWGMVVGLAQNVTRGVWSSLMNQTSISSTSEGRASERHSL